MKCKLTAQLIEATPVASKDVILWDSEVPGLACKITPKGGRSFFIFYRNAAGEQRKPKIGPACIGVADARKIAREWLVAVARGEDPSHDRKVMRTSPTISELAAKYIAEHAEPLKKTSSVAKDKAMFEKHLLPRLGSRKAITVTRRDVSLLHIRMRKTPVLANRLLSLLSSMFSFAIRAEIVSENPCRNIPRYRERKIHRDLNAEQFARLSLVLNNSKRNGTALVRCLLLTGCRRGELVNLRWDEVDLERGMLHLHDSKTGAKTVYLNDAAKALIEGQIGLDTELVFPSVTGKPLRALHQVWDGIRKEAGIPNFRIHDLRHNFASMAIAGGASLPIVGKLLGHKSCQTTQRYAVLAEDAAKTAAQAVGRALCTAN